MSCVGIDPDASLVGLAETVTARERYPGDPPTFVAQPDRCPACSGGLKVQKSLKRVVMTVAQGAFEAREVLKTCRQECGAEVLRSEALSRVVKAHQRYGYDLIVHVGLARYLRRLQREEIRAELRQEHGIEVSSGTVTNLCDRFLIHLEALHIRPSARIVVEQVAPFEGPLTVRVNNSAQVIGHNVAATVFVITKEPP